MSKTKEKEELTMVEQLAILQKKLDRAEQVALIAKQEALIAKQEARIAQGTFYSTIGQVWDCKEAPFRGSFQQVRRSYSNGIEGYDVIINAVTNGELPSAHLESVASSSSQDGGVGGKKDIFGANRGEGAHMIPKSKVCSPTYGIFAQAVLGIDLEADDGPFAGNEQLLKEALQQLACGSTEDKNFGLKNLQHNLLAMPWGHGIFLDDNPLWMVIPILSVDGMKNWRTGREYWVMVIAGSMPNVDDSDAEVYKALVTVGYEKSVREKCTWEDIQLATELLCNLVKAHADVLTGRLKRDGTRSSRITPIDLFHNNFAGNTRLEVLSKRHQMNETLNELKDHKVKVPHMRDAGDKDWEVLKVHLTGKIPDPMLVATKAAINWSARCGQKLLPSCSVQPEVDPKEEELYEIAREYYETAVEGASHPSSSNLTWL